MSDGSIHVEVAYGLPHRQWLLDVDLPLGATIAEAIEASGIRQKCPDIEISDDNLGIFSHKARLDTVLNNGDRVEIYRSLIIDPKESRRFRALIAKK